MKKKINKKVLSAIFLGLLMIGGGVLAMPMMNPDTQTAQIQENIKIFEKNPERFLQTEDLGLKSGFQYLKDDSTGNLYVGETNNAINEGALEAAIEEGNYEAWKEALQKIEGFPENVGIIDKEDFKILASLHKSKFSEEDEKTEE